MSYTPPAGNAVDFQDEMGTYTPPAYNAVDFQDESDAPAGSQISVWLGSAWVLKPLKRWDGSAWVPAILKRWDGSAWATV